MGIEKSDAISTISAVEILDDRITNNKLFLARFLHYLGILFLGGPAFVKSSLIVRIARRS